ncbi:MarR family winged helix-turn-helix transcriptional regulator [Pelagibacterium montanilacus]|uniref:MarR family winged helix-turn-helix transcriptional regulator n=1 Tax=Pelagibacterium montanilacus TaxID=2185280 RepID=UPI000F8C316F|nr:MarR family winged helix-turn-helix transcriptional regulator [Pelagibacterium montanilacus]
MPSSDTLPFEATLHVRDTCLCLSAQRAARSLVRRFDTAFKPMGITSGQFSLLMSLNRPEPPVLGSLAALLAMDRTTLTANLKPLERRGLIETIANPRDRRARLLRLTLEGTTLLARAYPIWTRTHAEIDEKLSAPDDLRAGLMMLSASENNRSRGHPAV